MDSCPNLKNCRFIGLKIDEIRKTIEEIFCKSSYEKCERYKRYVSGSSIIPTYLWPIRSSSSIDILSKSGLIRMKFKCTGNIKDLMMEFTNSEEFKNMLKDVCGVLFKVDAFRGYRLSEDDVFNVFKSFLGDLFMGKIGLKRILEVSYKHYRKRVDLNLFNFALFLINMKSAEIFSSWFSRRENGTNGEYSEALDFITKFLLLVQVSMVENVENLEKIEMMYKEHMEKLSLKQNIFLDALTGVFNRKYLTELRSLLEGKGLAVLMVDVDLFKKVNDMYGHDVGDLVLKAIANVCRSSVRNDDKVIRYGGEEFLIIIPTSDDTLAFKIAERIRRKVEMKEIKVPNGEIIRKTVSIGGTIMRSNEELEDAIKRADKALYEAKRMGRNIVVFV